MKFVINRLLVVKTMNKIYLQNYNAHVCLQVQEENNPFCYKFYIKLVLYHLFVNISLYVAF